jgi:hypothetical protein
VKNVLYRDISLIGENLRFEVQFRSFLKNERGASTLGWLDSHLSLSLSLIDLSTLFVLFRGLFILLLSHSLVLFSFPLIRA